MSKEKETNDKSGIQTFLLRGAKLLTCNALYDLFSNTSLAITLVIYEQEKNRTREKM